MAILSSDTVKMTSLLEKAISVIAPHRCVLCGNYDNVFCTACTYELHRLPPFCGLCGAETTDWRTCATCAPSTALRGVYVHSLYAGAMAMLVQRYKFDHARAAYAPIATVIADTLPYLDASWVVVQVPTVAAHVRARSYDHARLIAQEVARQKQIPYVSALRRARDAQQRGATRAQRIQQTTANFVVRAAVAGKKVLIVDDVCTTGATLSAAAKALSRAGAAEVWGAVAAWQPPSA